MRNIKPRTMKIAGVIAVILIIELTFDVFEVAIGYTVLMTNSLRPKIGRLWTEEKKDIDGALSTSMLHGDTTFSYSAPERINDLQELEYQLSISGEVRLGRENFINLYKSLPEQQAKKLVDPMVLYQLLRNEKWQSTRIIGYVSQMSIYFLDGYDQVLLDEYVSSGLQEQPSQLGGGERLSRDARFRGRIINAEAFWNAFDKLARIYKLQIINDPLKLVDWQPRLSRVGIARFVQDGSVAIAFELRFGTGYQLREIQASEISVNYLLQQLRFQGVNLDSPAVEKTETILNEKIY